MRKTCRKHKLKPTLHSPRDWNLLAVTFPFLSTEDSAHKNAQQRARADSIRGSDFAISFLLRFISFQLGIALNIQR